MGKAKEIKVKVIPANIANPFVKKHHYSGKIVPNSQLHFGAFLNNKLHGVLSFGPSMDKSKTIGLVKDTHWRGFLELNRMAFDEWLPKNSESRCIAIAIRLIKKNAPHIKWILSYSDATACGDGTIYRASGFVLTGINKNKTIWEFPDGVRVADIVLHNPKDMNNRRKFCKKYGARFTADSNMDVFREIGAKPAEGYQLRYIYLIDKSYKITVPILPFSKIEEVGAKMYKGKKLNAPVA